MININIDGSLQLEELLL